MTGHGVIGLDLGGAHLKLAQLDAGGRPVAARVLACALWQGLDRLEAALDDAFAGLEPAMLAVTLTGELVDLFPDRRTGVRTLVALLGRRLPRTRLHLFAGKAGFLEPDAIDGREREVASANWLATAQLVADRVEEGVLVDCGSTTTDIVPLAGGRALPRGLDDRSRLAWGELVYQGVVRTPLCALGPDAPFRGVRHALMNEWFATSADVHRLLGRLDEASDLHPAADGGAKTVEGSARRLARMIGCDLEDGDFVHWRMLAAWFESRQLAALEEAARLVLSRGEVSDAAPLVAAGAGAFLVERLALRLDRPVRRFEHLLGFDRTLGRDASICAPAIAVALLARTSTRAGRR